MDPAPSPRFGAPSNFTPTPEHRASTGGPRTA